MRPSIPAAKMRMLDARAQRRYGLPVLLLMDHAGRAVAEAVRNLLRRCATRRVIVVTGGGYNGGDGVAAARWLAGWGFPVEVYWLKNPADWTGDLAEHLRMARRSGVRFHSYFSIPAAARLLRLRRAGVLVDAILGTGTRGLLRLNTADAIITMNAARRPIVSVDLPSGLDADTGRPQEVVIRARATVTLAAAKPGLVQRHARAYVGRLIVADIGFPCRLVR